MRLGINNDGTGNLHLILTLGIRMLLLVLFGGFCGSMNNVFVHWLVQNTGNEIRKDCFKKDHGIFLSSDGPIWNRFPGDPCD